MGDEDSKAGKLETIIATERDRGEKTWRSPWPQREIEERKALGVSGLEGVTAH